MTETYDTVVERQLNVISKQKKEMNKKERIFSGQTHMHIKKIIFSKFQNINIFG